jgi:pilus assembly protein Flp/PilA
MLDLFRHFIVLKRDVRAVTALEYALIAGVIAVVMVVGASTLGLSLSSKFISVAGSV